MSLTGCIRRKLKVNAGKCKVAVFERAREERYLELKQRARGSV